MCSVPDTCISADNSAVAAVAYVTITVNNELRAHLPRNEGVYEAGFLLEALQARGCSNIPPELKTPSNKHKLVYFKTDYSEPTIIPPPARAAFPSVDDEEEDDQGQEDEDTLLAAPADAVPALPAAKQRVQDAHVLVRITKAAAAAAKAAAALAQQRGDAENFNCMSKAAAAAEQMAIEAFAELARAEAAEPPKSSQQQLIERLQSEFRSYHESHIKDDERRRKMQEETENNFDKRLDRIAMYKEWYKHLAEPTAPRSLQVCCKPQQQQQQPKQQQPNLHQPVDPGQHCISDVDYRSLAKVALHSCMQELRKIAAEEEKQKYVQRVSSWSQSFGVVFWRGSAIHRLYIARQLAHLGAPPFSCVPGVTSSDCMAAIVKNCAALFTTKEAALNALVARHPDLSGLAPKACTGTGPIRQQSSSHADRQAAKMLVLSVYVSYLLGASQRYMQVFSSNNCNHTTGQPCKGGTTRCGASEGRMLAQEALPRWQEVPRSAVMTRGHSLLHRLRLLGSKPSKQELSLHRKIYNTSECRYQQQLRAYSASPYPSFHEVLRDSAALSAHLPKLSLPVLARTEELRNSSRSVAGSYLYTQRAIAGAEEEEGHAGLDVSRSTASAPGLLSAAATASAATASAETAVHLKPCKATTVIRCKHSMGLGIPCSTKFCGSGDPM